MSSSRKASKPSPRGFLTWKANVPKRKTSTANRSKSYSSEATEQRRGKCRHLTGRVTTQDGVSTIYCNACKKVVHQPTKTISLLYKPVCEEESFRQQVVGVLDRFYMQHSWFMFIPGYIGTDTGVDTAARAFVRACSDAQLAGSGFSVAANSYYCKAVEGLRQSLTPSDSTLLTVSLLMLYVQLQADTASWSAHQKGVAAIIQASADSGSMSDLTRSVFYSQWSATFLAPCAFGIPSPYEDEAFSEVEPAFRSNHVPEEVFRLRRISHRQFIWLPRLIAQLRVLKSRDDGATDTKLMEDTIALAMRLFAMQDKDAESKMLHNVRVVETNDLHELHVTPYSFEFYDFDHFEAAILYWKCGILVLQLCIELKKLCFDIHDVQIQTASRELSTKSIEEFRLEQERLASNILMSCQFDQLQSPLSRRSSPVALRIATAALVSNAPTFRGLPIQEVRKSVLRRLRRHTSNLVPIEDDEDSVIRTTDALLGGPLQGAFVELYNKADKT